MLPVISRQWLSSFSCLGLFVVSMTPLSTPDHLLLCTLQKEMRSLSNPPNPVTSMIDHSTGKVSISLLGTHSHTHTQEKWSQSLSMLPK